PFEEAYPALTVSLPAIISQLETSVISIQHKDRFVSKPADSIQVKTSKLIKRTAFALQKSPVHLLNLLRSEKVAVQYWHHNVPLQHLATKDLYAGLVTELTKVTHTVFLEISNAYYDLKIWESGLNTASSDDCQAKTVKLDQLKSQLILAVEEQIDAILGDVFQKYEQDKLIAGTVELPARKLTEKAVTESLADAQIKWTENNARWKNTIFALLEKWRTELDILILKYHAQMELDGFQDAQIKKLADDIDPEIDAISAFISNASASLENETEATAKAIKKIVYQASKQLDKDLVPKLCDKLASKNISGLINKLEVAIKKQVEQISKEHIIVEEARFDRPIDDDDLKRISLNELVHFEILSSFQSELDLVKKSLFSSLEIATSEVSDLDNIIAFNLNSAISAYEEEQKSYEEASSIALDGLNRALSKLENCREMLKGSLNENTEKLTATVNRFCENVFKLTDHENLRQLKLRITKAKAALQAEQVKKEMQERLQSRVQKTLSFGKDSLAKGRDTLQQLSEKFILTAGKPTLTRDISDFLLASQRAIDRLPLIYKRLYRIEPLEDLELFEGRLTEIEAFKTAFASWQKSSYTTTVIIAEKWGGTTTFINFLVKREKLPYSVKRYAITGSIATAADLVTVLCREVIKNDEPQTVEEIAAYLNAGSKQIIALENIQNLYLRKPGGFEGIKAFLKLISLTCQNVFWVTSSTVYSWTYLKNTIQINEVFSNEIQLTDFTREQITNVILKRNRISGFNIRFLPDKENATDKKFLKYDDEKQQSILKEAFFSSLNSFSKSNVSLALIFWLLSTREVDDQTITIGEFEQPNLNFISSLSMNKAYILLALVLHDGLHVKELCEVLNMDQNTCEQSLFALQKDGVLLFQEDRYMVNTIIYRNVISLLKSKNLLH
ncbi:MAG: hypothetical protein AAFO69_09420, partial [Bacteroidota bacterium]